MSFWQEFTSRIFKVSDNYKSLFYNNNVRSFGDQVLYDLSKFCGAAELSLPQKDGDIAPLHMARMMGRLEVYQHVTKMLRMTETDRQQMIKKFQQLENQQQQNEGYL